MIDAINTQVKGYSIPCPKCGRVHDFEADYIDRIIDCDCGFGYYAFAAGDFRIVMSKAEAGCEDIVRSMRRFVVTTGRCRDIPPELYAEEGQLEPGPNAHFACYVREYDLVDELEHVLQEYQLSAFGECLFTRELIDSVCESLSDGKDVELKRKKDGIDIIELKKKRIKPTKPDSGRKIIALRQVSGDPGVMSLLVPGSIVHFNSQKPQNLDS